MMAMMPMSLPETSSDSSAPTPAEGSVDRIVTGWIVLSYSTPSTMYIVMMAARISHSSLDSDDWNASAAPWKLVCMLAGRPISCSAALMASTAAPSDAPRARLNEMVADGNWPWWLTTSEPGCSTTVAKAPSGTCWPPLEATRRSYSDCGPSCNCGSASSTTRYWLDCVKMVEIRRWPYALYSALSTAAVVMP